MDTYSGTKVSTFRERFLELCESSSMSATSIAKALHVSKPTISAWKSGDRSPKQPTIIMIARYFRVNVAWLMGFDVQREAEESEENIIAFRDSKELVNLIMAMTPEDYSVVVAAIDRTYKRLKAEGKM